MAVSQAEELCDGDSGFNLESLGMLAGGGSTCKCVNRTWISAPTHFPVAMGDLFLDILLKGNEEGGAEFSQDLGETAQFPHLPP